MVKPNKRDDAEIFAVDAQINSVMLAHVIPERLLERLDIYGQIMCSCGHQFKVTITDGLRELGSQYASHLGDMLMASLIERPYETTMYYS